MKQFDHLKLIDKYLKNRLNEDDFKQLQLFRQDPDFEETFALVEELELALRRVQLTEKLAYLHHLETSVLSKSEAKEKLSAALKELIQQITHRMQFFPIIDKIDDTVSWCMLYLSAGFQKKLGSL